MYGLNEFREIWVLDFEFIADPGEPPAPVCLVARELATGRLLRLWRDDLASGPPFAVDDGVLFVAYFASAEWGCFEVLKWPMPARVLDLFAEFRVKTNGLALPAGRSLLGAMSVHGISAITAKEKRAGRDLVMRGGPWSHTDRNEILDYCQSDVDGLASLFDQMIGGICSTSLGLGRALLRGRYTEAVARIEHLGVPIDVTTLSRLRAHWTDIKHELVASVDKEFGVYDGTTFKSGLFADWLHREGIPWPRTSTGRLHLDQDTFRDMAKTHPRVQPLRELRHALSDLRLEDLAVGADGRNRCLLSPFGARSGRNTPSNTQFIFGPSVWLRGLIKPAPGRALAYVDWSAQEIAIAAALSGDVALGDAVRSGDPYLAFAKLAGLAPPDATKQSYRQVRDLCKTCLLGTNYGMQARSLAYRTGLSMIEATDLMRRLAAVFPTYTEWANHVVEVAFLTGNLSTVLGWPIRVTSDATPTSLRNYPMQANGAEMLRLACCKATEAGIDVCAPVHDALLVEGAADEISAVIERTKRAMQEAAREVLLGWEIDTDVNIVTFPDRYSDSRGEGMWNLVTRLLDEVGDMRDINDMQQMCELANVREVPNIADQ